MSREEAGRKGGLALVTQRGKAYMAKIGKIGFAATVARYYGGDKAEYLRTQRMRAWEKGVGGFIGKLMQERLDAGESIVCEELPVVLSPDDDPSFEEPPPSWASRERARREREEDRELPF